MTSRQIGSEIPRRSGSISPKSLGSGGWVDFAMIRRRMINTDGSVATSSVDRRAKEFMVAWGYEACLAFAWIRTQSRDDERSDWIFPLLISQNKCHSATELCVDTRVFAWPAPGG